MTIRHAIAVFGLLVGVALASRAEDPAPPARTPTDNVFAAGSAVVRGATTANVVPGAFRAQLVVDNRFPLKTRPAKADAVKDEDRDPKDRTGKIHCLVCENGLSPVVAIFVRSDLKGPAAANLSKLIKGVDALIPKYRSDKMAAFVMFLKLEGGFKEVRVKKPDGTEEADPVKAPKEYPDAELEKREEAVKEINAFAAATGADNVPLGLAPITSPSIAAFGIGEKTPITIIIYNRLRMVQRWELKTDELTDEKIAEILTAAEEMVTGVKKKKEKEKD
jgi:hypothetical protein